MNKWQPIETAPKDGTRILACIKHGQRWRVVIARFAANGVLFEEDGDSCVGWDPRGKSGRLSENMPTWMPLPSPPSTPERRTP